MKKIIMLLAVCVLTGIFVSCTETDAVEVREASVADAVAELNTGSATLDQDAVRSIFDKAREIYKNNNAVTLSDGEVITPVNVSDIDLAYAQSLDPANSADTFQLYQTYLSDVSDIGIDMIKSIVPEEAVLIPENEPTTNIVRADMIIALDLEGCNSENVSEVLEKMNNDYPEYEDDVIVVLGGAVMAYDIAEGHAFSIFPSTEESKTSYALKNPSDPAAEIK